MWNFLSAFLPLIIIIGILYLTLRYVKNSGFNIKGQKVKSFKIKVLAGHMIMPKKFISVVQVEDKVLVLGVADSITLLKELDSSYANPPEEPDVKDNKFQSDNFIAVLKKNLGLK